MTRSWRTALLTAVTAAAAVAVMVSAPNAGAAAPAHTTLGATDVTAASTPAPTVSGATREKYTNSSCTLFSACLYERGYYFDLGTSGTHYLSYFTGDGHYRNNAVGLCHPGSACPGSYLKIYNINGTRLKCVPPNNTFTLYDFAPAWRVDITTSGC